MNTAYEEHEQWYRRRFGRRGTIVEALSIADLNRSVAIGQRHNAERIEECIRRNHEQEAYRPLQRAANIVRKQMRQSARKALWWGLVAQVRMQTGGALT